MSEMTDNAEAAFQESQSNNAIEPGAAPSDFELVKDARAGVEVAFEELFNRHRRRVSLIASRFFRQRQQVEEIVQESFTKAFFALSDFSNTQENSFAAWLARITFNTCYDELRRLKRRPEHTLSDVSEEDSAWLKAKVQSPVPGIESAAVSRDLAEKLLARLSPDDRLVLVMLDAEGLSVSEIAKLMKWSVPKVKVRAHRARASLRRVLKRFL